MNYVLISVISDNEKGIDNCDKWALSDSILREG